MERMCSEIKSLVKRAANLAYFSSFHKFLYEELDLAKLMPFTLKMFDDVIEEHKSHMSFQPDQFTVSKNEICQSLAKKAADNFNKIFQEFSRSFSAFSAMAEETEQTLALLDKLVFSSVSLDLLFEQAMSQAGTSSAAEHFQKTLLNVGFKTKKDFIELCEAARAFISLSPAYNSYAFYKRVFTS